MNALERLKKAWPFAFVLLSAAGFPASARTAESYGYVRVLDGTASVVAASSRDSAPAEINQPVLIGDRLRLSTRSHLEVVLADRNLLRIDGGSDLIFDRLAASPDGDDRRTVIQLVEGNIQLVVDRNALGDDLPRIETPNATITVEYPGTFRITAEREGWTQVVARRGSLQVDSERGTVRVRAGEELQIEDGERSRPETDEASGFDSLERWASRLDNDYDDDPRYIQDENLRYSARPLSRYGTWISIENRSYWRPTGVDAGWRPYWQGRWAYTPSGLTWVSYEPWGWVPYHYGSWDYISGYGWVWTPGSTFAPAHVYWYWGNDYVGWCPTGYYTRYYGGLHASFRFGVYGWANGGWDHYRNWSFVRPEHFGGRDQYRYAVPVDRYGRGDRDGRESPGRGIITTDTRPLRPELWRKPQEAVRTLSGWQGVDEGGRASTGKGPRQLPDVTSFIGRKPRLNPTELKPLVADRDQDSLGGAVLRPLPSNRPGSNGAGKPAWTQNNGDAPNWRKPNDAPAGRKPAGDSQADGSGWRKPGNEPSGDTPSWRKPGNDQPGEPPSGRKPSGEVQTDTPSWRQPNDAPSGRKPAGEPQTDAPSWRKPAETPNERKPSGGTQTDTPSWRKPSTDKPAGEPRTDPPTWRKPAAEDPPPPRGEGSGGSDSWRNRDSGSSGQRETPTWSKPAPSGDSGGASRGSRQPSERPAPPPQEERRPAPSTKPSGGSSDSDSSSGGGSSSGGSTRSKPAPSGDTHREASPRKPSGGSGGSGGSSDGKGRARATPPPADSDDDGGDGR